VRARDDPIVGAWRGFVGFVGRCRKKVWEGICGVKGVGILRCAQDDRSCRNSLCDRLWVWIHVVFVVVLAGGASGFGECLHFQIGRVIVTRCIDEKVGGEFGAEGRLGIARVAGRTCSVRG